MIAAGGRLGRPEVEAIHNEAISRFGGMPGLRDPSQLDAALAKPCKRNAGVELYQTGNKRTAAACMAAYLRINGVHFKPRHDELYDAMVGVAEGTWGFEELAAWVEGNVPAGAGGM